MRVTVCLALVGLVSVVSPAQATSNTKLNNGLSESYVNALADAIYKAEGGAVTRHPYGILAHYKTTTPRQACINTIRHKHRDWVAKGSKGDFLVYLASKYCPVGAENDPRNLNKNWLKNVRANFAPARLHTIANSDKPLARGISLEVI